MQKVLTFNLAVEQDEECELYGGLLYCDPSDLRCERRVCDLSSVCVRVHVLCVCLCIYIACVRLHACEVSVRACI